MCILAQFGSFDFLLRTGFLGLVAVPSLYFDFISLVDHSEYFIFKVACLM